jgi:DNA-binding winged helix-turn-helix (wHTH) protein/tetratricopeptide (TPR) repeat protein
MSIADNELYEFGDFRLDVGERRVEALNRPANGSLREKPFQTLVYLVRNSGRLVTKQELISAVWPDSIVEEGNLGKAIHAIRIFLGEKSGEPTYIETVPKHGYRFIAEVRRIGSESEEAELFVGGRVAGPAEPLMGPKPDQPPLVLAAEPAVSEVVFKRKNNQVKFAAFAAAGLLIVAITASYFGLSSLGENAEKPSETETEIASAEKNTTRSPAYDLYIRGKVKVANENREDTVAAIALLEEAVSIDPTLAQAYAQLARAYNTMAFKFSADPDRKRFHENADVAIEKALELNQDLAEGHFARGLILWSHTKGFPHEHAIRSYQRSLQLDPNSDETHHQLSLVYSHVGLLNQARESVRRAIEINPNNTLARFRDGVYLQYQGKFEDALAVFRTIPRDHTPLLSDRSLAETMIQSGRLSEAESIADDYLRRFPQDEGGSFTGVKALVRAKQGDAKATEELIERAVAVGEGYGHFHHTAYNIACAYAALGRPADSFRWLRNAADNGFPNYSYFAIDPNLAPVRDLPEFTQLMVELRVRGEHLASIQ